MRWLDALFDFICALDFLDWFRSGTSRDGWTRGGGRAEPRRHGWPWIVLLVLIIAGAGAVVYWQVALR